MCIFQNVRIWNIEYNLLVGNLYILHSLDDRTEHNSSLLDLYSSVLF